MSNNCIIYLENNVVLSPQSIDEWEGTDVTMTCSYNGSHEGTVHWNLSTSSNNYYSAVMQYFNNSCRVSLGWLNNVSHYSYNCTNEKVFNLTLKRISRQRHGEKWTCIYNLGTLYKSNTVILFVKGKFI